MRYRWSPWHGPPTALGLLAILVGALVMTACGGGAADDADGTVTGVAVQAEQHPAARVEEQADAPAADPAAAPAEKQPAAQDEGSTTVPPEAPSARALVPVDLLRIIDGDTIEVRFADGARDTVRYIGVDTPETVAPGQPVQAFGPEASARNVHLLAAGAVFLESDLTDRDRFDRLLRYVWVDDGSGTLLFVNFVLVAEGLATVRTYPPDVRYLAHYEAAEAAAQAAGRGIWGAMESSREACSSSYPSVCIPPPPPDLDCGDIPFRRFPVPGSDPHRFDGDRNGIGCER